MIDNNTLLQYNTKNYGKFIPRRPINFLDLKTYGEKFTIPYSLPALVDTSSNPDKYYYSVSGLNTSSFYTKTGKPPFDYTIPKKFAIIKHGEYAIKQSITNFSKTIYELLVIFPDDFIVPGHLRMIKFFGKSEWFEPFLDPQTETSNFIKELKKDLYRKR